MMSAHTPGPWRVDPFLRSVEGKYFNGEYHQICGIVRGGSPQEASANARLIAAAPDLLDALRDLIGSFGTDAGIIGKATIERAYAALAKAEGY